VWGTGNRSAKILLLGEGPGAEEVDWPPAYDKEKHGPPAPGCVRGYGFKPERFRPFIGGSGRLLTALLAHAGIHRDTQTFVTNTVKCRPPDNRNPTNHEIGCCAHFLQEEIADVDPNVIIAAGDTALGVLTEKKKIGLWRGVPTAGPRRRPLLAAAGVVVDSIEETDDRPYKVFPTWHPAFIARAQYYWPFAVHDLFRAKAQSRFPEIERIPVNIVRDANTTRDRESVLADIRARGAFTFDFETTGLSASSSSILMCGIVPRPDTAYVFDWTTGTKLLFQELLDDDKIEIIGQNILNFDLPFAEEKGTRIRWTRVFDTMVAFHLTNSSYGQTTIGDQNAGDFRARGAEKDLAFIASNHTDIEYWKSREDYKDDLKGVCGTDSIATDRSAMHPVDGLKAELKKYDMLELYYDHVLPVHPILRRMTQRGVNIDLEKAGSWSIMLQENADRLEAVLKEGLGDPGLNLNSPKQLMELLYGKLGLQVQYNQDKKRGRVPTVNKEALEVLATLAPENVILRSIVDIRHLRKMDSTFVQPMVAEGRVHARFGVSKASNGRFNSWNPNAQNVPETMRDIWIADDDDCVLISADSSQIEWRNAMVLSGDPVGLELLASGVDNHKAVAAETLGRRIETITDDERHASKFIVYGLGYGRGAASISEGHNLDFAFVQRFIGRFFSRFKVFHAWRESLPALVHRQHYLANAWKRRRWWWTREITEIYNYPASSTAADQMIEQLIALDRELPAGATLRLTVHDEVVINCPKDIIRETLVCIRTNMQRPWPQVVDASANPDIVMQYYPNGWFVPADIHIGSNWSMCKSKNEKIKKERKKLEQHLGVEDLLG
jgi:uracil-DNA glycosylase family 4